MIIDAFYNICEYDSLEQLVGELPPGVVVEKASKNSYYLHDTTGKHQRYATSAYIGRLHGEIVSVSSVYWFRYIPGSGWVDSDL